MYADRIRTFKSIVGRSSVFRYKTPFEMWTGHKPKIGHLRIFGCTAVVLNKMGSGTKFGAKGVEYIMVGYSMESKAYRLFKPNTKKIIKSRDVLFIEKVKIKNINSIDFYVPESKNIVPVISNDKIKKEEDDINEN